MGRVPIIIRAHSTFMHCNETGQDISALMEYASWIMKQIDFSINKRPPISSHAANLQSAVQVSGLNSQ